MLLSKYVSIKWSGGNKKYYTNKGYEYTKCGKFFNVKIEDLPQYSKAIISLRCDYCGKEYTTNYSNYYKKKDKSIDACVNCKINKSIATSLPKRQEQLLYAVQQKCDELGYKLLSNKTDIVRNTSYIRYKCPKHGEFEMRIANLLTGKKCPKCNLENRSCVYRLEQSEIIKRVKECGGNILNPQDYINQAEQNLKFICSDCGKVFISSFRNYTQHGGQVCPSCNKHNESIGEKKIRHYLEEHNISFKQEFWFNDCRDKYPLPFDFYLPNANTIIEFDGRQHFGSTTFFHHSQETTPIHDKMKNQYCQDNNIDLIRIPYWQINNIDSILDSTLLS